MKKNLVSAAVLFVLSFAWSRVKAATCATTDTNSYLVATTDSITDCTGYVVMDSAEYLAMPTLQTLFAYPDSTDVAAAWLAGFTLPMICYLAAWGFGAVVNYFKPEIERY